MTDSLQYVSNAEGQTVSVIVPISLWQEIMAERETAYLLSSPKMRTRLLVAKKRHNGISLEEACEKLGV
jgi:PHD/YefM family antitoxin component YafN of YafNO toxin-antitoxin module